MTRKVVRDIRIDFQSTPQLWLATREGWEPGGIHGLGRTPVIALAVLLEQEMDAEECTTGDNG